MPDFPIQCSSSERRRIDELLIALRTPVALERDPASLLMTHEFVDEFQSRLLSQHVFLGNPLFQQSFETAFITSARTAGFEVEPAPEGQRFWDIRVNGRRISLKSSKAKSMRADKLHISKLTEAAWIQDCRNAAHRRRMTIDLFSSYCDEVDEIIQLRYFEQVATYEMVGIEVPLFEPILDLAASHFSAGGPTINIPIGQIPPDFTLKLDRSDAKITIGNIRKDKCRVHGKWRLPKDSAPAHSPA